MKRQHVNVPKLAQTFWRAGVTLVFVLIITLAPAIAQKVSMAPVVLDGRQLFEVSATDEMSSSDRANLINSRLQEAARSLEPVEIMVEQRNEIPTILIDDGYLLSVTEADTRANRTALEQAQLWAQEIETAVQQAQQYRNPMYIQQGVLLTVGFLAIALALHWGLGRFWQVSVRPTVRRLLPTSEGETEPPKAFNLLINGLLAIVRTALWLGVVLGITNLFPMTRYWSYNVANILLTSFTSPVLALGRSQYSIISLLILGVMLLCLVVVSKTVTELLKSRILQRTLVNRGAQEAIAVILRYSIIFIGSLVLLQLWGLDISSLTILASALSVGIGFGLQDIAKNFGSGLVLVFERPIQVGDFVEVGEFQGTVERIGARSTLIRTLDQVSIIVPNSRFLEHEVINWSHDNPISRIHIPVGVAYSSDVSVVRSVLMEAAKGHPSVLSTPESQVFFKGFGDSSLDFELLVWTAEPSKQLPLKSDLYFRIEELLRKHKIEVPFPQRDLYLRADRLPVEFSPQLEQALHHLASQSQNGHDPKPKSHSDEQAIDPP